MCIPKRLIGAVSLALLIGGCVSPSTSENGRAPAENGRDLVRWTADYGDPQLPTLVERALAAHPRIESALARVAQAHAGEQAAVAANRPAMSGELGLRWGREQSRMTGYQPDDVDRFMAGVAPSWELDLSGRLRARFAAAQARLDLSQADLEAARLLLSTEITRTWLHLARLEAEAALSKRAAEASRGLFDEIRTRFEGGLAPRTALLTQESASGMAQRMHDAVLHQRELATFRLAALLGEDLQNPSPLVLAQWEMPLGPDILPVEALHTRPDVAAAEALVREHFALAEAARADLYPRLQLSGLFSGSALRISADPATWIAAVGPTLEIPIWDPIRLATLEGNRAQQAEAAADFRNVVLRSIEEVRSAAETLRYRQAVLSDIRKELAFIDQARQEIRTRQNQGLAATTDALEVEQTWLEKAIEEALATESLLRAHIDLVSATGGPS